MKTTTKPKKNPGNKVFLFTVIAIAVILTIGIIVTNISSGGSSKEIDYTSQPTIGNKDAKIHVIEIGDFKCPACKMWEENVYQYVKRNFIDHGDIQFHFINFAFIGPDSKTAAYAGEALLNQNNDYFWKYYDLMYKNQKDETTNWATEQFIIDLVTREIPGVDIEKFKSDMKSDAMKQRYQADEDLVKSLHVPGTPAVLINGKLMKQAMDYNEFIQTIIAEKKKAGDMK